MHIFKVLVTSVQSFKPIALKPVGGVDYTNLLIILKPNLKIAYVEKGVILIFFLSSRSHMHIFNILITSMQSFKLIACIPWRSLA